MSAGADDTTRPAPAASAPIVLPHKKPELLEAFFAQIPDDGCGWPADRREIWLRAFTNALELLYDS